MYAALSRDLAIAFKKNSLTALYSKECEPVQFHTLRCNISLNNFNTELSPQSCCVEQSVAFQILIPG